MNIKTVHSFVTPAIAAAAAILGFSAFAEAPTPLVVWDGADSSSNFSTLEKTVDSTTYTIGNVGGTYMNSVADDYSYLQVGSENQKMAILVSADSSSTFTSSAGEMTVLIKAGSLPLESSYRALITLQHPSDSWNGSHAAIGISSTGGTTGRFIWQCNQNGTEVASLFDSDTHNYALTYSASSGTAFYIDSVQKMLSSTLKSGSYKTFRAVTLGGLDNDGSGMYYSQRNTKIYAIAIFNSALTAAQLAEYVWPSVASAPTLTLTGDASWSTATGWSVTTPPTSGNVAINVTGDVTLTVDAALNLGNVTVTGSGSLKLAVADGSSFAASLVESSDVSFVLSDSTGVTVTEFNAPITYLYKTDDLATHSSGRTYTQGAGTSESPVTIAHNGGSATLIGGDGITYYLDESNTATESTVVFTNAAVSYATKCGIGQAAYTLAGTSTLNTPVFILSQGANGRNARFTIKDTASVTVTGTTNEDTNQSSVMFGHWNGPTTFIIQDDAKFTAASQVLVGKTNNDHMININGGVFTATGIKLASYANGTNILNLNGGSLVLGDVGITAYTTSQTMSVNVNENTTITASASTLPISQAVTVADGKTLTFTNAVSDTTVQLTGGVSGTGSIVLSSGMTLDLGTGRTGNVVLTIPDDGALKLTLASKAEIPVVKVSEEPATITLYDTDGTTELTSATKIYDAEAGTVTFKVFPVWTTDSATGSFDTAANWSTASVPTSGDVSISLTQDTVITVSGTYTFDSLTIAGSGKATFTGDGSITVTSLSVEDGASLDRAGKISAESIALASGCVLLLDAGDGTLTESAVISGEGAVETYGNVTMAAANTFTGGITAKTGTLSTTSSTGFGPYSTGWGCGGLKTVTVEDGACVDIAGAADNDVGYKLVITGKGVLTDGVYSGAVKYTGTKVIGSDSRQMSNIQLNGDALVDVGAGWGLVHSSHYGAALGLNGHTLTFRGTATVPMVNVDASASSGTIVLDGAKLQLTSTACNFTGVQIVARGCSSIDFETAPSALGGLIIEPTASGTTASNWNLPDGTVPAVNSAMLEPGTVSSGTAIFTAPSSTTLSSDTISANLGSRYTATISDNTVTVTENTTLSPFIHYDFNASGSIASDSTYNFGNLNPTFVNGRNGTAGTFNSEYKPYWDSNTSGKSPIYAGAMTVSALMKISEHNNTILWNFGSGHATGTGGIAIIAKDSSTLALATWASGEANGSYLLAVTGLDLVGKWHLVTVVANGEGTTLYVDGESATTDTVLSLGFTGVGQFGSIHGTAKNYNSVSGDGFCLDDFRVYDTALTDKERKALQRELNPSPFYINIR